METAEVAHAALSVDAGTVAPLRGGVVDVATSNSVNTIFMRRENPRLADQIEEIWQSPPIPESGIAIREDLDPALKEKIRSFFLTYGQGDGPEAERQRQVLAGLNYSMFRAADDSYLDPVREMVADQKLGEARAKNDQAGVAAGSEESHASGLLDATYFSKDTPIVASYPTLEQGAVDDIQSVDGAPFDHCASTSHADQRGARASSPRPAPASTPPCSSVPALTAR